LFTLAYSTDSDVIVQFYHNVTDLDLFGLFDKSTMRHSVPSECRSHCRRNILT